MIKSMTGYGKGESKASFGNFAVEVRTLNHRYFDISSRIPSSLTGLEDRIKSYVHKDIKRGKVNFSLSHRKGEKSLDSTKLNHEAIEKYHKMLNRIKKKLHLKDDIKLSHLLSFPDVIVQEQVEYNIDSVWPVVKEAIRKAALDCNRMRVREGKAIYRDLIKRINKITSSINQISRLVPRVVSDYKRKLDSRVKGILKGSHYNIDGPRLETELAIFAKQCDISEEITRAKSHLMSLKNILASDKEAGRRIDFILQELQREINTLGSKIGTISISRSVVDIKSEIEKIREQAQNVE